MNRPPFIPFDEHRAVRIYQRSLPHWRQDGACYFVTFRLGDSIPVRVSRAWNDERSRWLAARLPDFDGRVAANSTILGRLSKTDQFQYHKHFSGRMQEFLDRGVGACYLNRSECLTLVRSQLLALDCEASSVGDFVIMPNHVHLLIVPSREVKLEEALRKTKGATSYSCNVALGRRGRFWQPESYDHIVRSLAQLRAYRDYIAANPRKAGIVLPSDAIYRAAWMDDWFRG